MFNFFKKTSKNNPEMVDGKDCEIAHTLIFKYLYLWFKQIFSTPEWEKIFAEFPDMERTMAAEVGRYLLVLDEPRSANELEKNEKVTLAKQHAIKWADDTMNQDKEFCEFVIQTLRIDSMVNTYLNGGKWAFEDPQGIKISDIITKYGKDVPENINPKKYKELLTKWMLWDKITEGGLKYKKF